MYKKSATKPVIQHIFEDVKAKLFGNPEFEEYTTKKDLIPVIDREGNTAYIDPGAALQYVTGEPWRSKQKIDLNPAAESDFQEYGFPKLEEFGKEDRSPVEQMSIFDFPPKFILFPSLYESILGYHAPGLSDSIFVNKRVFPNAKQHLEPAQALDQIGKKEVKLDAEKQDIFLKTVYSAIISNSFLPKEPLDEFKSKVLSDAKYRERVIKALAYPAYSVAVHEAIHRKYLKGAKGWNISPEVRKYVSPIAYGSRGIQYMFDHLWMQGKLGANGAKLQSTIIYASIPAEMDAQLLNLKVWCYIQTGKTIKNKADAERALNTASLFAAKNPNLRLGFPEIYHQSVFYGFLTSARYYYDQLIAQAKQKNDEKQVSQLELYKEEVSRIRDIQLARMVQL